MKRVVVAVGLALLLAAGGGAWWWWSRPAEGGPGFVYVPNTVPDLTTPDGFTIALADDVANQAFAGMWTAGGLRYELPLSSGEYGEVGVLFDAVSVDAQGELHEVAAGGAARRPVERVSRRGPKARRRAEVLLEALASFHER